MDSIGLVVRRWRQCSAGKLLEGEQQLLLSHDLGYRLGPLRGELGDELLNGSEGFRLVPGLGDLPDRLRGRQDKDS